MNRIIEPFRIEYKYGDTFKLKPIMDIHKGAATCDLASLKRWLADDNGNTYYLMLGDLLDCILANDPRYRKSGDESPQRDDVIDYEIGEMAKLFSPIKSRIIGIGTGNHEDQITKRCGTNPSKRLALDLGVGYLGYSFLSRLMFSENGGRSRSLIIRGHHGWGGGCRTQGGSITKYSNDAKYFDADLFIYGHDHRKQYDKINRLTLVGNKLVQKPKHLILGGAWKKTYSDSTDTTWEETKGFPPTEIGGVTILMRPEEKLVSVKVEE